MSLYEYSSEQCPVCGYQGFPDGYDQYHKVLYFCEVCNGVYIVHSFDDSWWELPIEQDFDAWFEEA